MLHDFRPMGIVNVKEAIILVSCSGHTIIFKENPAYRLALFQ